MGGGFGSPRSLTKKVASFQLPVNQDKGYGYVVLRGYLVTLPTPTLTSACPGSPWVMRTRRNKNLVLRGYLVTLPHPPRAEDRRRRGHIKKPCSDGLPR
jgi:hypothetical protein